jgi:two-component system, NarL family, sensor kinase
MGDGRRALAPALVAGAVGALGVATVILWSRLPHSPGDAIAGYAIDGLMWTLMLGGIGVLVLRDSPANRLGPLLAAIGIWFGLGCVAGAAQPLLPPTSAAFAWCAVINGLWIIAVPAIFLIPHLYPDGRTMSPRWHRVMLVAAACIPVVAVGSLVAPQITWSDTPGMSAVNPAGLDALGQAPIVVAIGAALLAVVLGLAALGAQVRRARTLEGEARARIGWLVAFFTLLLVAMPTQGWVNFAVQALSFACLATGILRHHLFDIQRVLSRSVSYALLVAAAMLAALLTAALLGSRSDVGVLPALAAAVVAVALASGFTGLRRRVDRWVYGPRSDPAEALAVLGERLRAATDAEDVLPQVVSTVRESLQLPYAAIALAGEPGKAAESGARGERTVSYPLRYGGQDVGVLELGPRPGDTALEPRDERLVAMIAAQAGSAAHSAQTLRELRRSREQLVSAREEERRALRRDLHDGLGPALAGMALGLQSLERGATEGDQARLAADLLAQARQSLDEVRRLARDLRPAALDELGLAEALRQHAQAVNRMGGGTLEVQVVVDGDVGALPAAVEVAAYRISQEALSNATRHASAAHCVIDLSVDGSLQLAISDDGNGLAPRAAGTGLRSMRERAEELGGTCTVTFRPGVGTEVLARLPAVPA